MKETNIHLEIKNYFSLVDVHYKQKGAQITFQKGYWWTDDNIEMQSLEKSFILYGTDEVQLLNTHKKARTSKERSNILHLMGWSPHIDSVAPILVQNLSDPSVVVSNAAARSLFPLVVSKKYKLDVSHVITLLHRRSKYHKNKSLGLLLYWPCKEDLLSLSNEELLYIKKQRASNNLMYAPIAQMVLVKIESLRKPVLKTKLRKLMGSYGLLLGEVCD